MSLSGLAGKRGQAQPIKRNFSALLIPKKWSAFWRTARTEALKFSPRTLMPIGALADAWSGERVRKPRKATTVFGPTEHIDALHSSDCAPFASLGTSRSMGFFTMSDFTKADRLLSERENIRVRPAVERDVDLITRWMYNFNVEEERARPNSKAFEKAMNEVVSRTRRGDLFLLEDRGVPVSFCGVKRHLSNWLYVCPVWTPREERGNGYAGVAVAGALKLMNDEICRRSPARHSSCSAALFATSVEAARAYGKIGFTKVADYRETILSASSRVNSRVTLDRGPAPVSV